MTAAKDKGTRAETAVVRYMESLGLDDAHRQPLSGAKDIGDVRQGNAIFSVKNWKTFTDGDVDRWLVELEQQRLNAGVTFAYLICARYRKNIADWWLVHDSTEFGPVTFRFGRWAAMRAGVGRHG